MKRKVYSARSDQVSLVGNIKLASKLVFGNHLEIQESVFSHNRQGLTVVLICLINGQTP